MLVNILQTFDFAGVRYFANSNPDVDAAIARQWISDGKASADSDGKQDSAVQATGVPVKTYRGVGDATTPVASFDGAGIFAAFGLAVPLKIEAGKYTAGAFKVKAQFLILKNGTGTASVDIRVGPLNSTSDPAIFGGAAPSWTATNPQEIYIECTITFGTTSINCTVTKNIQSASNNFGFTTEIAIPNLAVDNWFNIVIAGAAAGSTYKLIHHEFQFFQ